MLERLVVTNLAILENIDISFKNGFTVLTGATGAGKSLVIDSLSLLLGSRASSELIRQGEEKATVKGYFSINNKRLESTLLNLDIPSSDGNVTIERIITGNKNIVKINGITVSLNDLNKVSKFLADIHNQFDVIKMLNPENYLDIVDGYSFDLIFPYKNSYIENLTKYRNAKDDYDMLIDKKKKIEESREFFEYQLKELKEINLKDGEIEDINNEISLLSNYDKIYSLSQEADEIIHSDFNDKLYDLVGVLSNISKLQNQYQSVSEKLKDYYYEIDDTIQQLSKDFKHLDYDPKRLDELQGRLSELSSLQKKYKKTIPELIDYINELESLVGEKNNIDIEINVKKQELDNCYQEVINKGNDLTTVRKKVAAIIEKEIIKNLKDLLLKVNFEIDFKKDEDVIFYEDGLDQIDFKIETNIGEGMKSLDKVISGGEASRIMLAFKAIFIKANKISTVIFDEIDTGVSGEAAESVAKKIYDISLSSQVIAITHLPQVASLSDHHILVKKEVKDGRTYTNISELNLNEKIMEIAHLISSGSITEKQIEYAKEMVLRSRNN
uniref:DNA repair protein RecN n=1 Tax=uncultured bacterium fosmid pJB84G2 TaxID=1478072 RepID=A0A0H3U804_9BACT|nr:hypothetical protein [uncultured bacterium fosmid pJB84G2]